VEGTVGAGVEIGVGTGGGAWQLPGAVPAALDIRLLGPLTVTRAGKPVALPPSRKVRALLAYLVLATRPIARSHLCELLWDVPSDVRGELRWCLSKLRGVLDEPGHARVITEGDQVSVDLAGCHVDVVAVTKSVQHGLPSLPPELHEYLASLFGTREFLEGLDVPRSPGFTAWVLAERRRLRAAHAAVLEHWVQSLPLGSDDAIGALGRWLALAPFDRRAHEKLLDAFAARGRLREAEEHLAATARQFEAEGQDWAPIGHAWRAAKQRHGRGDAISPIVVAAPADVAVAPQSAQPARRASLAVMPFVDRTPGAASRGGLGDGIAYDVITRLSKLRSMFVIAEGTMFALAERRIESEDAGRRLDVDYVASGSIRRAADGHLTVGVQLMATRTAQVVWAEEYTARLDDTFAVLQDIGDRIVTAIANQIEQAERNRAILKNPNSPNAWEAHHRGLWHMVRFNREDNEQARHFFQSAIRLDPTFARPHAGLSFTHFQDAFLGWTERDAAIDRAYRAASEAVMADEQDPAAHWALGRALWLQARDEDAQRELHSATELSPNFAMGHYTLAWFQAQSGDADAAIERVDRARELSPMDPMLFAMMATRALALLRLGRYEEAAEWAARSALRPNAHVHVQATGMFCLALAGRVAEARQLAAGIRRSHPGYRVEDFLLAFRLGDDAKPLLRQALRQIDA
jgi:DNA-binding SARP family transcriptional activator